MFWALGDLADRDLYTFTRLGIKHYITYDFFLEVFNPLSRTHLDGSSPIWWETQMALLGQTLGQDWQIHTPVI